MALPAASNAGSEPDGWARLFAVFRLLVRVTDESEGALAWLATVSSCTNVSTAWYPWRRRPRLRRRYRGARTS